MADTVILKAQVCPGPSRKAVMTQSIIRTRGPASNDRSVIIPGRNWHGQFLTYGQITDSLVTTAECKYCYCHDKWHLEEFNVSQADIANIPCL